MLMVERSVFFEKIAFFVRKNAKYEHLAVPMGMLRHLAKSLLVKTWGDRHTSVCLFAAVRIPCLMGSIPGTPDKNKIDLWPNLIFMAVPMGIEPMLPE